MSLARKYQHVHRKTVKSFLREHLAPVEQFVYRSADRMISDNALKISDPVFMVGSGRCGTTLFHHVMKRHQDVVCYSDEASPLFHPTLHPWANRKLDAPPIVLGPADFAKASHESWPANQDVLIKEILRGFHKLRGRSKLFFLKSAMLSHSVEVIESIFPTARFMHLYRHGLSVTESYFHKEFRKHLTLGVHLSEDEFRQAAARYWNDVILELDRQQQRIGSERFFSFSYEDFCERPKAIQAEIAGFLNIDASRFGYPLEMIENQNTKAGDPNRSEVQRLIEIMQQGLHLHGYL